MIFRMPLLGLFAAGAPSALPALAQDAPYGNRSLRDAPLLPPAHMATRGPLPVVFQDNARVVQVTSRIEQVSMLQEECYTNVERLVPSPQCGQGQNIGGAIIGGIAGSLLDNQIGGGNGRAAATAIGAVGGALVSQNVASTMKGAQVPPWPVDRQVRRCSMANRAVERNACDDVNFIYNSRTYETVQAEDLGPSLRVNVTVNPSY